MPQKAAYGNAVREEMNMSERKNTKTADPKMDAANIELTEQETAEISGGPTAVESPAKQPHF